MQGGFVVRASAGALAVGLFACGGIAVLDDESTGGVGGLGSTGNCPRLLDRLRERSAKALRCTPEESKCEEEIFDACGCAIPAEDAEAATKARAAYQEAFEETCFAPCAGCTPSPGAACLKNADGDFVCTPQR